MTPTLKAALQASLKQEDEAVKARLHRTVPPAAQPVPSAAPAKRARKNAVAAPVKAATAIPSKPETAPAPTAAPPAKRRREAFSLAEGDSARLKSLKNVLGRQGHKVSRSELVRAGIQLLGRLAPSELIAATSGLQPLKKNRKK